MTTPTRPLSEIARELLGPYPEGHEDVEVRGVRYWVLRRAAKELERLGQMVERFGRFDECERDHQTIPPGEEFRCFDCAKPFHRECAKTHGTEEIGAAKARLLRAEEQVKELERALRTVDREINGPAADSLPRLVARIIRDTTARALRDSKEAK